MREIFDIYDRDTNKLVGEIQITDDRVTHVYPHTRWTSIQVGMPREDAERFLRNHDGQATYVDERIDAGLAEGHTDYKDAEHVEDSWAESRYAR